MKLHFFPAKSGPGTARQRGIALIIVLSILVLITGLVVGFLARVGTERISAGNYIATMNTRQLADAAVNLVQAQINQATSRGSTYAWASQPGAVRVFNNAGNLDTIYRLYSASTLNATKGSDLANDLPTDSTWPQKPAQWVDLNAPSQVTGLKDASGAALTAYPIFDPRDPLGAAGTIKMNGFQIGSFPGAVTGSNAVMPVQWLYVLQDGRILPPTSTAGTSITISQASATNPIVGRIAYWTDDETCKININTAGGDGILSGTAAQKTNLTLTESYLKNQSPPTAFIYKFTNTPANVTFWDTPHFNANDEVNMALSEPVNGEFQRYPGHPATVPLRDTLDSLGLGLIPDSTTFYSLLPRYKLGGSTGGTIKTNSSIATGAGAVFYSGTSLSLNNGPLYATVSEMLFSGNSNPPRKPTVLNQTTPASRQRMETARFFLSAHSRAPELNLFGQPRVSIWPVYNTPIQSNAKVPVDAAHITPIDQLLAFTATSGTGMGNAAYPYYFTRQNSTSSSIDVGIQRNAQLLTTYLDRLTSSPIPGFGGNFQTKYGVFGAHQIIHEIFDYIRTINTHDCALLPANQYAYQAWLGTGQTGQVTPTKVQTWQTQGIGDYPRLVEAAIHFVQMGSTTMSGTSVVSIPVPPTQLKAVNHPKIPANGILPLGQAAVQPFLLFAFANPSQSSFGGNPNITFQVTMGPSTLTSGSLTNLMGFPSGPMKMLYQVRTSNWIGSATGYLSPYWTTWQRMLGRPAVPTTTSYPFYGDIVPVLTGTAASMNFSGFNLTVQLLDTLGVPFQTYNITFPKPVNPLPIPGMSSYPIIGTKAGSQPDFTHPATSGTGADRWNLNTRWIHMYWGNTAAPAALGDFFLIDHNDVVRSMVLSTGWSDIRMLNPASIPATAFVKHPHYDATINAADAFCFDNTNLPIVGNTVFGNIVPNVSYQSSAGTSPKPLVTPSIDPSKGVLTIPGGAPGDWDTGSGLNPDGPWVNRVDEGVSLTGIWQSNGGWYGGNYIPYFNGGTGVTTVTPATFTANREVPSPAVFGSLPTGINLSNPKPWQTLLFRPGPGGGKPHPGEASPKDHLLLDFFWMPVAEPYAISEPFSTAGKINLNYQIVPFNYITRSTALRALLSTEKVAQIAGTQAPVYKTGWANVGALPAARLPLDLDQTLSQFNTKFGGWDIYRSASEICDIWLVPTGYTLSNFQSQWYNISNSGPFAMVGDNVRERPYCDIYPKVTTKSNTFTVYFTVQSLKNSNPPTDIGQQTWTESKGSITGEYRGSTTIERAIDSSAYVDDFGKAPVGSAVANKTLESTYKWGVIENHQFAP